MADDEEVESTSGGEATEHPDSAASARPEEMPVDDDDDDDGGGDDDDDDDGPPIPGAIVVKGPSATIVVTGVGVKGRSENNPNVSTGAGETKGTGTSLTFKPTAGYVEVEIIEIEGNYTVLGIK